MQCLTSGLVRVNRHVERAGVQIRPYSSLLWLRRCGFLRARAGDRRTPSLPGVARARRVDAHELQATLWHGSFPAKHLDHKPALCLSQILLKLGMERSSAKPSARPNKASGAGRRRYVTVLAFLLLSVPQSHQHPRLCCCFHLVCGYSDSVLEHGH